MGFYFDTRSRPTVREPRTQLVDCIPVLKSPSSTSTPANVLVLQVMQNATPQDVHFLSSMLTLQNMFETVN